MKVKMKEHNGTVALVVSGTRQQLIITEEEDGFFSIEVAGTACNIPTPVFAPAPAPVPAASTPVPVPTPEYVQEEEATDVLTPSNDALFKKLALLRKSLAVVDKVPPYLVFHDKTLLEMADKRPADMQAMGHISGVGQAKLEKYGPVFLDAINGVAA